MTYFDIGFTHQYYFDISFDTLTKITKNSEPEKSHQQEIHRTYSASERLRLLEDISQMWLPICVKRINRGLMIVGIRGFILLSAIVIALILYGIYFSSHG